MASFIEIAKKVIRENQEWFETLEEFDRTGDLRKAKYKSRYNFTIDEELMNRFRSYCRKKNIKLSNKIEELIKKELYSP